MQYEPPSLNPATLTPLMNPALVGPSLPMTAFELLRHTSVGLALLSLDGRFLFANEALAHALGETSTGLIGKQWIDYSSPFELERDERALALLASGQMTSYKTERRMVYATGESFWASLELKLQPAVTSPSQCPQLILTVQDLTEWIEGRREIEESQTKVRLALGAANIGIWEFSPQEELLKWDVKTATLMGLPTIESISRSEFESLVHPDDLPRVRDALIQLLNPKFQGTQATEFRVRLAQGERILATSGRGFHASGVSPRRVAGTVIDITESKLAEQTLRAQVRSMDEMRLAKEAAEKADQMKSSFLANMSHEIRTPLGAILGFTEILVDGDVDEAERSEFIQIIARNGQSLSRIVDDILDLSKVEAGLLKIEKTKISPHMVASDSVALFQERARAKALRIDYQLDPGTPQWIYSDANRIRQILSNLISNAIKFTERGGVTVRVMSEASEWISILVTDTGIGIGREQISRLFQPFSQGDDSMSRRFGGTGLGLHLSRKLAEAMGGSLEIEASAPGQGTSFLLRVPVGAPMDERLLPLPPQLQARTGEKTDLELPLLGKSILVVDDSKDNQVLIERFLAKKGADVDFADNGAIGVERALNAEYDLILMDLQMPEMDGFEATETLRQENIETPIIALTAHVVEEIRNRCKAVGCTGFLTKPLQPQDLIQTVIETLRTRA